MSEKLQKVLANAGLGSRRKMETWIEEGRVSVNGAIASLGARVELSDEIRCDGKVIPQSAKQSFCRVLMYNKPEGEICSRDDPEGRKTVFERLPRIQTGRWIAIGRLDINTSGLLLFTNDGELANRLMHPRNTIEREYAVRVFGEVSETALNAMRKGVVLDDGPAKFEKLTRRPQFDDESLNAWFNVVLREGRNREVRRIWESQSLQVSRLIRTRYGDVALPNRLPQGAWVEMELGEINKLRRSVQLPNETETALKPDQEKLDHIRLSRMRRSIKKHNSRQATEDTTSKDGSSVSKNPKSEHAGKGGKTEQSSQAERGKKPSSNRKPNSRSRHSRHDDDAPFKKKRSNRNNRSDDYNANNHSGKKSRKKPLGRTRK